MFLFHFRLVPDSQEYASGKAWWSSSAAALAGLLGGWTGVCVLALLATTSLGFVLGLRAGMVRSGLIFCVPPSWYTVEPSAESIGALAAILSLGAGPLSVIVVSGAHLVAGLSVAAIRLGRKLTNVPMGLLALATGTMACLGEWHLQVRYFLPGLCVWAVTRCSTTSQAPSEQENQCTVQDNQVEPYSKVA